MRIAGKTALVTGGTDGIGYEIARQLKERGAIVAMCGRDAGRLTSVRDQGFQAIETDLSTKAGCDAPVEELSGVPIDILVNNAGMGSPSNLLDGFDLDQTDRAIFLNLNAPMHLIAGFLPALRARPEATIVNVTSGSPSRRARTAPSIARPRPGSGASPRPSGISYGSRTSRLSRPCRPSSRLA